MKRKRVIAKGNLGRLGMLCLALVVALAGMSVGYAQIQGGLQSNGQVLTNCAFTWALSNDDGAEEDRGGHTPIDPGDDGSGTNYDRWGDESSDDPSKPQQMGTACARYDKDVARTTAEILEEGRQITVTVENAYPCYYPTIFFGLWCGDSGPGTITTINITNPYPEALTITTSGIHEGQEIPPGEEVMGAVHVHVEQAAAQNAVYTFTISITVVQNPAISIVKVASPTTASVAGTQVTYTYTVTNTGSIPLTSIEVSDDKLGDIILGTTTLAPGESTTGTASYNITEADIAAGDDIVNVATVTCNQGVTAEDDATVTIEGGDFGTVIAGGCPTTKYLTVDWEGNNTTKPLYSNDRLAVVLPGPSPDGSHSLLLERGTHAPVVDGTTHYLIVVKELEEIPPLPENTMALMAFNMTPAGAVFDREILLTLGLAQSQLPENALNVTMAYYDDTSGTWEKLEYEAGGPSGVAELTLSAPINHFSIFGVLAEIAPTPLPPAHFIASSLNIVPSVEKIWKPVTFVTRTGESATVTANIANDGGQVGTYTVELKLNGEIVDSQTVMLGAGQSREVSFTLSEMDYGQYQVEVAGVSDTFTVSRTINWWLIVGILVAIGLIGWAVARDRRKRKAHKED
ncbi:MAG: hypothetical protein J7L92_04465 [Dehalococcoidia bacterium]|nr:hypothetical protein [Dehalococcoidia bacterium]